MLLQSHHLFSRLPLSPPSPSQCSLLRLGTAAAPRTHRRRRHHIQRAVRPRQQVCLGELAEEPDSAAPEDGGGGGGGEGEDEGPILLPPSSSPSSIFATSDDPSPLQVATSVLLTGAISVFLFRSLRRRAERVKEMRVRSTGVKKAKDLKEEALESLKVMGSATVDPGGPPSPAQAFLGGIAAGVIAIILYKFSTTIEASLNRQTISDNLSVRQITITIRTIINGLCYLATFIFGVNSIGLMLYSGQLAISSFMEPSTSPSTSGQNEEEQVNTVSSAKSSTDNVESSNANVQQRSDDV